MKQKWCYHVHFSNEGSTPEFRGMYLNVGSILKGNHSEIQVKPVCGLHPATGRPPVSHREQHGHRQEWVISHGIFGEPRVYISVTKQHGVMGKRMGTGRKENEIESKESKC